MTDLDIIVRALRDEADDRGLTGTPEEDRIEEVLNRVADRITRMKRVSLRRPLPDVCMIPACGCTGEAHP